MLPLGEIGHRPLELGVHGAEQRGDGRAHLLVGDENDYRDRRYYQCVLGHRLTPMKLTRPYNHFCDHAHSPILLLRFFSETNLRPCRLGETNRYCDTSIWELLVKVSVTGDMNGICCV